MGSSREFEYLKQEWEDERVKNNYCRRCYYKREHIDTSKYKKVLLEKVSNINNYDEYNLTPPYEDMNLSSEDKIIFDNWLTKVLTYAAKLASEIIDDIDEC